MRKIPRDPAVAPPKPKTDRYYNEETGFYEERPDLLKTIKKEYPESYERIKKIIGDPNEDKD